MLYRFSSPPKIVCDKEMLVEYDLDTSVVESGVVSDIPALAESWGRTDEYARLYVHSDASTCFWTLCISLLFFAATESASSHVMEWADAQTKIKPNKQMKVFFIEIALMLTYF
jgi:hypothetical protein